MIVMTVSSLMKALAVLTVQAKCLAFDLYEGSFACHKSPCYTSFLNDGSW